MAKKAQFRATAIPCAYCGKTSQQREHVFPRSIYPAEFTGYRMTVRACHKCGQEKQQSDDVFRDMLASDLRTHHHPVAQQKFWGPVQAAAIRRQSVVANRFAEFARAVELHTMAGIYVQDAVAVPVDDYIDSGIRFIGRGLTRFHFRQFTVPKDANIQVASLTDAQLVQASEKLREIGTFIGPYALGDPNAEYPPVAEWGGAYVALQASGYGSSGCTVD